MAPDNSYRLWVFDGEHRHVKLYDKSGKRIAKIDIHRAPGIRGWEIYHPRWSNNLRILTVTGPYSNNQDRACPSRGRKGVVGEGGYNIELYIGRFALLLKKVEKWVRVTYNDKADFHGDAWVEEE